MEIKHNKLLINKKKLPEIEVDSPGLAREAGYTGSVSAKAAIRARKQANWGFSLLSVGKGTGAKENDRDGAPTRLYGARSARSKTPSVSAGASATVRELSAEEADRASSRSMILDFSMLSQRE